MTDDSYIHTGDGDDVSPDAISASGRGSVSLMPPPATPIKDLNGYDAQSIRDSKKGKVKFFFDPTHVIARAFGGRQFFFEEGVLQLHRVGLLSGLGWILPYTGGNMDINCIKVIWSKDLNGQLYNMEFGKVNRESENPPETWELVKRVVDVPHTEILQVYKEIVG